MAQRLRIDTTLHRLRHYPATELINSGVDIRTIAGRLVHGGGGATTLRVYAAWLSEADQRAASSLAARMPARESRSPVGEVAGASLDSIDPPESAGPYQRIANDLRGANACGALSAGDPCCSFLLPSGSSMRRQPQLAPTYAQLPSPLFGPSRRLRRSTDRSQRFCLLRHDASVEEVNLLESPVVEPKEDTRDELCNRTTRPGKVGAVERTTTEFSDDANDDARDEQAAMGGHGSTVTLTRRARRTAHRPLKAAEPLASSHGSGAPRFQGAETARFRGQRLDAGCVLPRRRSRRFFFAR